MEFHCVTVNGAASDDQLELSSSTSNSSSSSSSSQSSTDNNSSSASPPSLSPPLAQQSASISITVQAPVISSARVHPPRLTREQTLKSLKESIPHAMKLQKLKELDRDFQKDASWHKKAVRRLSKDLYVIVSMYVLLQGVLFTAVAQSSVFTCADRWGPAFIVVAVTVGTIKGALEKLHRMGIHKQEVKKFERRQSAVYDKIAELYFKGAACNIECLDPEHNETFDEAPGILNIFSGLVLGFLVAFSALIMASCLQMLCRPCHCKK